MSCTDYWKQVALQGEAQTFVPRAAANGAVKCTREGCVAQVNLATQVCVAGHVQGEKGGPASYPRELDALVCALTALFVDKPDLRRDGHVQAVVQFVESPGSQDQGITLVGKTLGFLEDRLGSREDWGWRFDPRMKAAQKLWDTWCREQEEQKDPTVRFAPGWFTNIYEWGHRRKNAATAQNVQQVLRGAKLDVVIEVKNQGMTPSNKLATSAWAEVISDGEGRPLSPEQKDRLVQVLGTSYREAQDIVFFDLPHTETALQRVRWVRRFVARPDVAPAIADADEVLVHGAGMLWEVRVRKGASCTKLRWIEGKVDSSTEDCATPEEAAEKMKESLFSLLHCPQCGFSRESGFPHTCLVGDQVEQALAAIPEHEHRR